MSRGLFRLYLALWLVWFSYGVIDNYKELATYYGYDKWTIEKAQERSDEKCKTAPTGIDCFEMPIDDFVSEESVNVVVWMFNMAMIKAPFYLLIFLVAMYSSGKWVIAGFRRKKDAKT